MKWSLFWYSRRESNPKFALRRGMLDPFNYGSIFSFLDTSQSRKIEKYLFGCKKDVNSFAVSRFVSELTPKIRLFAPFCLQFLGYSTPLGGVCYIHLTTEAYLILTGYILANFFAKYKRFAATYNKVVAFFRQRYDLAYRYILNGA